MNGTNKTYKRITNIKTYIVAIIMFVVGIVLILLADLIDWGTNLLSLQTLLRDFGSLLIASIAVAVVWELFSKRAFYAEALAASNLVDDIITTGLIGASARWHGNVDWQRLFRGASTIRILFIYGRTWRNTHRDDLLNFAIRANTSAVIVLPDPTNEILLASISQRTGIEIQELRNRINETQTSHPTV